MADIITAGEQALALTSEEYIRKFVPPTWTTLRLGLWATTTCSDQLPDCEFEVGFCSGATNGIRAASTTHFIGINITGQASPGAALRDNTKTAYANANAFYLPAVDNTWVNIGKRVLTSVTNGTYVNDTYTATSCFAGTSTSPVGSYIDITKGSPNYTVKVWADTPTSTTAALFRTNMITPTPTGYDYWEATVPCDEADGAFNAVNIYWNSAVQTLRIHELLVAVMA